VIKECMNVINKWINECIKSRVFVKSFYLLIVLIANLRAASWIRSFRSSFNEYKVFFWASLLELYTSWWRDVFPSFQNFVSFIFAWNIWFHSFKLLRIIEKKFWLTDNELLFKLTKRYVQFVDYYSIWPLVIRIIDGIFCLWWNNVPSNKTRNLLHIPVSVCIEEICKHIKISFSSFATRHSSVLSGARVDVLWNITQ